MVWTLYADTVRKLVPLILLTCAFITTVFYQMAVKFLALTKSVYRDKFLTDASKHLEKGHFLLICTKEPCLLAAILLGRGLGQ